MIKRLAASAESASRQKPVVIDEIIIELMIRLQLKNGVQRNELSGEMQDRKE